MNVCVCVCVGGGLHKVSCSCTISNGCVPLKLHWDPLGFQQPNQPSQVWPPKLYRMWWTLLWGSLLGKSPVQSVIDMTLSNRIGTLWNCIGTLWDSSNQTNLPKSDPLNLTECGEHYCGEVSSTVSNSYDPLKSHQDPLKLHWDSLKLCRDSLKLRWDPLGFQQSNQHSQVWPPELYRMWLTITLSKPPPHPKPLLFLPFFRPLFEWFSG